MIRKYQSGDESFIADLEKECFSEPWSEKAVKESVLSGTEFILFEDNEKILGYAGIQIVLDEGYITNIAVTASARRQGVGSALVKALKELSKEKELSFISLEVRQSNTAAITLYDKLGFKTVGRRKNFYTAPIEDALIMTLEGF